MTSTIKLYNDDCLNAFNKITQFEFSALFEKNINNRIFSVLKNNDLPLEDRLEFFKETNKYSSNKNKALWFFIFKRIVFFFRYILFFNR